MPTIIVTDGEQRSSLAIVRSLGRAGHRCVIVSISGRSLAGASRHAAREVQAPDPGEAPDAFVRVLSDLVVEEHAEVVIPVTEEAILAVLPHRESIGAIVPFPDRPTFHAICDKSHVLEVARTIGIRVPRQREILSREDSVASLELPLVLKPARSVYTTPDGRRAKVSVAWARVPTDLRAALDNYSDAAFPILAQEVISGSGLGVFAFVREGQVVARFAHRRILEKPPSGGVSVLSRSEPMDDDLYALSTRLLSALDWSGVAMVEYKRDSSTGEPVLMEINGRFWGSLQLAIDAGVDFPRLVVDAALGLETPPALSYRPARMRWEWGHVDHLIARWRGSDSTASNRLCALADWIRAFRPGIRGEVLRFNDPGPFFRETDQWFRHVVGR